MSGIGVAENAARAWRAGQLASETRLRGSGNRTVRLAVSGRRLASSLPVHRRAMHGYPGLSVATQYQGGSLRRLAIHPPGRRSLIERPTAEAS